MANILDEIDVIKNIENMYESNSAFNVLKDFERVLDDLDIYVYENWEDGELAAGPIIDRHWVSAKFLWQYENMPDPMGGKRLLDYDCKVAYEKSFLVKPRQIVDPDDIRPGTKKGKLDRHPIWIVEIQMPKKLLADLYQAELDDLDVQEDEGTIPQEEVNDQVAPEQAGGEV
tara:strand:- start:1071 stop:1586 length:516 start_codon:yes stop_codon:yes gene_type:complete